MISIILLLIIGTAQCTERITSCTRNYEKLGCYVQDGNIFPTLLVNDRLAFNYDGSDNINVLIWDRFGQSLWSLACRCRDVAEKDGFLYFSISNHGECWGSNDEGQVKKMLKSSKSESNRCVSGDNFQPCDDKSDLECAGVAGQSYVYKVDIMDPIVAVDGVYDNWSSFSKCSKSCGGGRKSRSRSCNNPPPSNGGIQCIGKSYDDSGCNNQACHVNGGVSEWTQFTKCSSSCGRSSKTRTRVCDNPSPSNGGAECVEHLQETEECNLSPCPVDGGLSQWTQYNECSASCGQGSKTRTRACNNPLPSNGGEFCVADLEETDMCNVRPCPVDGDFSNWTSFTKCSKSCGGGTRSRKRYCTNPSPMNGGKQCSGSAIEYKKCNTQECKDDTIKERTACEDKTMDLQCATGRKLEIRKACYGRQDRTTCIRRNEKISTKNNNCCTNSSLHKVKQKCQDRNSCSIRSANSFFKNDPCQGASKYLTVRFKCV